MLKAVPVELKEAQAFIDNFHRHHIASKRDKFRIGCEKEGKLVGVAQVGKPISRMLDDGKTLEVLRLCSLGDKDVCSFLYSRCARVAKEMGYKKIITYILESEIGTSLRASGWAKEAENVGGGSWDRKTRHRTEMIEQTSLFQEKTKKYPTEKKQRWVKEL